MIITDTYRPDPDHVVYAVSTMNDGPVKGRRHRTIMALKNEFGLNIMQAMTTFVCAKRQNDGR